ncbi:hypothetical protein FQN50_008789 [Emmonsiellopsis sp. PD_5]|nr:hypothetical protein FQN50_008789 [Emmonsiellopsis sp. PD_5]
MGPQKAVAAAKKAAKTARETITLDPTAISHYRFIRFPRTRKPIQGRPRFPNSSAAVNWRTQETVRLRKALQRLTHGKNIFAYNNIRTNQVIYSLTRYLEEQNVLSQLIYHGKKTVPATLRKDMWTPYFSVHFPDASKGLEAYRLLREFSVQRQLAPPVDLITATEDNAIVARKRPRDPLEAKKWDEEWKPRFERKDILNKKLRAKVLMDQKATSVADVAAVLEMLEQEAAKAEKKALLKDAAAAKDGEEGGVVQKVSNSRRKRLAQARRKEQQIEEAAMERIRRLEHRLTSWAVGGKKGKVALRFDRNNAPTEHHIVQEGEVKVFWNDLFNSQFAREWPKSVIHGQLKPTASHIMPSKLYLPEEEEAAEAEAQAADAGDVAKVEAGEDAKGEEATEEVKEEKKKGLGRLKFW